MLMSTTPTRHELVHRGHLVNSRGGVSALCFSRPRSINLGRATWTNRDEAVNCPRCLALLQARNAAPAQEGGPR